MSLAFSTQAGIAYKNLLGKSNTDTAKTINNEAEGIFLNVTSDNVWTSSIDQDPDMAVAMSIACHVMADLVYDTTSNGHSYFALWPSTPPSGIDPDTETPFSYGAGVLASISAGDRVKNSIDPKYGYLYEAKPYDTNNELIPPGDPKNWVYEYNSGIFFQEIVTSDTPLKIYVYVYIGTTLSNRDINTPLDVRIIDPSLFPVSINQTVDVRVQEQPIRIRYEDTMSHVWQDDITATTDITSVGCTVYNIDCLNYAPSYRFLKLYDMCGTIAPSTHKPLLVIPLVADVPLSRVYPRGLRFSNAVRARVTLGKGQGDINEAESGEIDLALTYVL